MRRSLLLSLGGIVGVAIVLAILTAVSGRSPVLGLDLRGGLEVVLKPHGTANNQQLQEAVSVLQRRVDGLGLGDTSIERTGDTVTIELPGESNTQRTLQTLEQQGQLFFRPVLCEVGNYAPPKGQPAPPPDNGGALSAEQANSLCSNANAFTAAASTPSTAELNDSKNAYVMLPTDPATGGTGRLVLGPSDMTGSIIKTAIAEAPQQNQPGYSVQLTLTGSGATAFDKIAGQRYAAAQSQKNSPQGLEAFDVDGVVKSAPSFNSPTFHGQVSITGKFTQSQTTALANALSYGSLPVKFVPQSVQSVSASVGSDSLHAGIWAGIVGIAIVLIYMLLYYRALALVVIAGVGVGGALLYAIITQLSHSNGLALTLEGITGIIVSVGITVDSYVVYFERLKDEIRAGKTVRQSVERSFNRAFRTVLTADFVTILAAVILYALTVGDVRGFAFMLGLSTLLDIATAVLFIRPAVILVGRKRAFTEARFIGVASGLGARRAGSERATAGSGVKA